MSDLTPQEPWSERVAAIWGKTSQDDSWLSLCRHLEDASAVAGLLWDRWLPHAVKNHIGDCLPEGVTDGRILLTWLAGIHDIGKATPAFAVKAPAMLDRLHRLGFDLKVPLPETRHAPHGALGYVILRRWLTAEFPVQEGPGHRLRARTDSALAVVIGAHHGLMPDLSAMDSLVNRPDYLGGSLWGEARAEILDRMARLTGAHERLPHWLKAPLPATAQATLAAAVVVADWLASDESRFPYRDRWTEHARWDGLRLPEPWSVQAPPREPPTHLSARFPSLAGLPLTPIQQTAIEAAWDADRPPLLILEAEMGSGKTEAGLAAAEVLAHRFGQGGVFVALPTMATSDAMFGRVRQWVERLPGPRSLSMFLAHGKAGLNDEYRGLTDDRLIGDTFTGVYDDDGEAGTQRPTDMPHATATVNSWMRGRRKGVLAPFVVGTIDQVLFGALRSKHLALRHLALAGKVVVVDEVHAADTYMRQYLTAILTWLGAYGTPVVLMSATLPSEQRQEFVAAYAAGASSGPGLGVRPARRPVPVEPAGYPRTVMLDSRLRDVPTVQVSSRPRSVAIEESPDALDHLAARLRADLAHGGCVAVVRNTVTRAQETWGALRAALPGTEVVLVHSRFLAVDRARREAELRRCLGRASNRSDGSRPHRLVVVGTQVLEQSLDIDVDLMVSDLAPVDLLLQRMGRLHRHPRGAGESDRPPLLRSPRFVITGADWDAQPVTAVPGSRRIYGEAALLRAAATLRARGGVVKLADDIPALVEAAYDSALLPPPGWERRWEAADRDAAGRIEEARSRAGAFRLPAPSTHEGLLARSGFFSRGDPDDGNGGRSQVRDSEDSLEVVVVQRVDGFIRPMPGADLPKDTTLTTDFPPEPRIARALAGCTVRLPSWATMRDPDAVISALEDMSFAGWQQDCPWLAGQLTLVLDHQGRARIAELEVAYEGETGLTVMVGASRAEGSSPEHQEDA